ncbi:Phox-like protein [Basidiobolus meristosporus CBS 931.73]|uniref:Phox-like protein n=1 Tax=Basidiobolus meristosporus CBS 931.73 TaxID=1314790 RepID=A0A1Y1Z3X3_9FUNG|nr:Phox-like protein [Basidiobolus meristosporus CBS 931.73]|eukprot:ORY04906.1 Phox-like protein [Basidiobolus meristosporus CBS 931.73]
MSQVKVPIVLDRAIPKASQYSNEVGVLIPKKVIRAIHDYHGETPYQLSFRAGDFFHVIGNENNPHWWEATNPMTKVRGLVPASYFEVIDRKQGGCTKSNRPRNSSNAQPALLGHVLYDFESQSPEELSAEAGDHIIIVGKSSNEWLIAKHIGKLGGLGLVPSSYVEIKDARTGLPVANINQPNNSQASIGGLSPREQAIRAGVSTYFQQDNCYYFEVQITLLDGHNRVLYKLYEDFYDFHVALLKAYPKEAGNGGQYRIIPYMPGPVTFADESITIRRCQELNVYVRQLFGLPKYIQESKVLREFFGLEEPGEDEANPFTPISVIESPSEIVTLKVKIQYHDDLIAIRVPSCITYDALHAKIAERLENKSVSLQYRLGSNDYIDLNSQRDLQNAWSNGKLFIYAS